MVHKPVLLGEVIESLNLKPGDTVVDGTLGAGGHSAGILEKILPGGKLISIDWDGKAVKNFENFLLKKGIAVSAKKERIFARIREESKRAASPAPVLINKNKNEPSSGYSCLSLYHEDQIVGRWCGINENYANLDKIIRGLSEANAGVDALFLDLGFSSDQIEDPSRGFSFLRNGSLDMRYSPETMPKTAADIVNSYSEQELGRIIWEYGEEKYARRIARKIVEERKARPIENTEDLIKIISKSIPEKFQRQRVNFATKTFQALRIETNGELENLKEFLNSSTEVLASGGRLAIISFHSLEDRIVKNFFRDAARDCVCPPRFPKCVCSHRKKLKVLTKRPIFPTPREIGENPRSRSAKLRVAEKI